MRARRHHDDDGVAAIELALVTSLLLGLVGYAAPLGIIYYESVQLGRTANDVVRFASSRPVTNRVVTDSQGVTSTVLAGRLPSTPHIDAEISRGTGTTGSRLGPVVRAGNDPTCPGGKRLTLTVQKVVDLGALSAFIPLKTKTLSATATSCEE